MTNEQLIHSSTNSHAGHLFAYEIILFPRQIAKFCHSLALRNRGKVTVRVWKMLKKEEHLNFYRGRDNAYHAVVTFF